MIKFPDDFVALKRYPGYFWSTTEQRLYSMKVSGILRPLSTQKAYGYVVNKLGLYPGERYWSISKNGRSSFLTESRINRIVEKDHQIPITRS